MFLYRKWQSIIVHLNRISGSLNSFDFNLKLGEKTDILRRAFVEIFRRIVVNWHLVGNVEIEMRRWADRGHRDGHRDVMIGMVWMRVGQRVLGLGLRDGVRRLLLLLQLNWHWLGRQLIRSHHSPRFTHFDVTWRKENHWFVLMRLRRHFNNIDLEIPSTSYLSILPFATKMDGRLQKTSIYNQL